MPDARQAPVQLASRVLELDDAEDLVEYCYDQGWTDGLPVVPPTVQRVGEFLAAAGRPADEVIVDYADRSRVVTVEAIAINAVMAGCKPEYFPVVLALVEAMADPAFLLHAANSSTSGMALMFVVNGPIRDEIGMNYRGNVLGPGNRANSTIGRAIRLTQINAMGSVPGAGNDHGVQRPGRPILDRSTLGQPAKYAGYHVPEFEEAFPTLLPLHVMRGFTAGQSTVTLFNTAGHLPISAHGEQTAAHAIETLCTRLLPAARPGASGECFIVLPPENAATFVRDGYAKADIGAAIHHGIQRRSPSGATIAGDVSKVNIVVAGGPAGAFVAVFMPYAGDTSVTREIIRPDSRQETADASSHPRPRPRTTHP